MAVLLQEITHELYNLCNEPEELGVTFILLASSDGTNQVLHRSDNLGGLEVGLREWLRLKLVGLYILTLRGALFKQIR